MRLDEARFACFSWGPVVHFGRCWLTNVVLLFWSGATVRRTSFIDVSRLLTSVWGEGQRVGERIQGQAGLCSLSPTLMSAEVSWLP